MIAVTVTFKGPFRVSQGTGEAGVDDIAHRDSIPASSLKGNMRAMASRRLDLPDPVVERLFGSVLNECPWAFDDLSLTNAVVTRRVRIPIDEETGSARRNAMLLAEEVWVNQPCTFEITWLGAADEKNPQDAMLIAACALAMDSLGSSRRRGLGWVETSATIDDRPVSAQAIADAVLAARATTGEDS